MPKNPENRLHHPLGFTLIELSIVLVILGLIVGGVLVGRDMIHTAQIRASISQYEKFTAAAYTFKTKYGGLPGDLANAGQFGFIAAITGNGVTANDGLLQSSNGFMERSIMIAGHETTLFWQHLSVAGMIAENLTAAGAGVIPEITAEDVPNYFPPVKIGRGNSWTVYNENGSNYYGMINILLTFNASYVGSNSITPQEAFQIDSKMDDGAPLLGIIRGIRLSGGGPINDVCNPAANGGNGDACCGDNAGGSANIYKTVTATLATTPACSLSLRM